MHNVRIMGRAQGLRGTLITTEASLIKGNLAPRAQGRYRINTERTVQFLIELDHPNSSSEFEIFRQIAEVANIDPISVFLIESFVIEDALPEGSNLERLKHLQSGKDCAKVSW